MADPGCEQPPELEFWSSDNWVDIWAGVPLRLPRPETAAGLVWAALLPGTNVNFPQITEICERIMEQPPEAPEAIGLLVGALRDGHAPLQKKLKALTISNELVYDGAPADVFMAFGAMDGMREALTALRTLRDAGARREEICKNIRMFATELERKCFAEGGAPRPGQLWRLGSALKTNVEAAKGKLRRERHESSSDFASNAFPAQVHPTHISWSYASELAGGSTPGELAGPPQPVLRSICEN